MCLPLPVQPYRTQFNLIMPYISRTEIVLMQKASNTPQGGTLFSPHAVRGILFNPHVVRGILFNPHALRGLKRVAGFQE
jgi:hypothetical protein